MNKLGLEKAEGPEIKLPTFTRSEKKQGNSRKTSTSASLNMWKPLTVWITTNCGKFLNKWGLPDYLTISRETSIQVKNQQLKQDKEQQTGSKWGKEYIKAVYCHLCLTYMQSTSCKMSGWMMFKLESLQIYGKKWKQ